MCPVAAKSKNSNTSSKKKINKKIDSNLKKTQGDEKIITDQDNIHEAQFATTGQVVNFGDLTIGRWSPGALSDSHGGIGGF